MRKWTWFEFIGVAALTLLLVWSVYGAWTAGKYWLAIPIGLFALLGLWSLLEGISQGIRAPASFEHFEQRMFLRGLGTFLGGAVILSLLFGGDRFPPESGPARVVAALVVVAWLAVSGYFVSRTRSRVETSTGYRRRVGYRERETLEEPATGDEPPSPPH